VRKLLLLFIWRDKYAGFTWISIIRRRDNADYVLTKIQITRVRGCVRRLCKEKKKGKEKGGKTIKGDIGSLD
jgi:hypothetical protein